jgi:hypothetical protein
MSDISIEKLIKILRRVVASIVFIDEIHGVSN